MESGVQVTKAPSTHYSVANSTCVSKRQIMSPVGKPSKLPPINSQNGETGTQLTHPSGVLLDSATSELKESMKYLLSEAQSAENRIQQAIESLWQKMMDMLETRTQDYEMQLTRTNNELKTAKEQLEKITEQEAALVQQNAKMSIELVTAEKRQKAIESELKSVGDELKTRREELGKLKEETGQEKSKQQSEAECLKREVEEKNRILKEYQDKISKMTEKVQKLTKHLAEEKAISERLQKSTSSQLTQQTSDNRKMALEISKLKSQLAASSTALAASKEEIKKLELQLKRAQVETEATVTGLHKQHSSIVQALENKIEMLKRELADLQSKHESEIALLKQQLEQLAAEGDDGYMDARIRFLQHQNRQEKIKISKERKKQS